MHAWVYRMGVSFIVMTILPVLIQLAPVGKITRLTFDGLDKERPTWSSDGRFLAFTRHETGGTHIWQYIMERGRPESAKRFAPRR